MGPTSGCRSLQQAEAIALEPPALPEGPFRVIVADPPWMSNRESDLTPRNPPYPTMPVEEIQQLKVGNIAAEDCVLWLWTTNNHIRSAFDVLDAWGFNYKTMLTWAKQKFGTGKWLRGQTEPLLTGGTWRARCRLEQSDHAASRHHRAALGKTRGVLRASGDPVPGIEGGAVCAQAT